MAYENNPKKNPGPEGMMVPDEDLKPVADELDALLGPPPAGEEGEMMAEEMATPEGEEAMVEEEMPMEEAAPDLAPLMDMLGATEERAQMLYDAAQQLGKTQGKTPEELAKIIVDDFDVLMQLEMIAARDEGGAMGGPTPEMAPPMEMPAAAPTEMEGM